MNTENHPLRTAARPFLFVLLAVFGMLLATRAPVARAAIQPLGVVSAGGSHSCALRTNGSVECWGDNTYGQLDAPPGPFKQISAGGRHVCGLTALGDIECWGDDTNNQLNGPPGPYVWVSAGVFHTCGLRLDGSVECWGAKNVDYGQTAAQPGPFTNIDTGNWHSCGLKTDGSVECWGDNSAGQSESQTGPFSQLGLGDFHTCGVLAADDSIFCWGQNTTQQADSQVGPFGQVSGGLLHSCGLLATGAIDCWGNPPVFLNSGQTADVAGEFIELSAGSMHNCALRNDGFVYCWGNYISGQLDDPGGTFGAPLILPSLFASAKTAGETADGVAFDNSDILMWDGAEWSMWFDGSAAGLDPNNKPKHNTNAFWIPDTEDDDVIMSFGQNGRKVPGISDKVDGTDLVRWDGESFTLWFDGSDVGLTKKTAEKIDGLHVLPGEVSPIGGSCAAYLLVSTQGPGNVPNHEGGVLKFGGEDVLGFCATNLGDATDGFWHIALDGSAAGLKKNAIDSISGSAVDGALYLTVKKPINLGGGVAGGPSLVFSYDVGSNTVNGPHFSAPHAGMPRQVDGLQVQIVTVE